MTTFSTTSMYALTVQPPSATAQAIVGNFTGKTGQQILTTNGSRISILEVLRKRGVVKEVFSQDVFAIIRHVVKFRLAGSTKDCFAISTDSGRLVTYEYLADERELRVIHNEAYGKSGIRRVIPGEHMAVDPKGRAIMLASLEKNKLVYILTRSGQTDIAISSPLEAHKPQTLVYYLIGLDDGYNNPLFAALELDFSKSDTDPSGAAHENLHKDLVFYELDLGLNYIVRKCAIPVDRSSNLLFRVPGGPDMPSGVLCCGEDNISYHTLPVKEETQVQRLAIPRREGSTEDPNRKRIIVAGTLHTPKKEAFFYLLQTEDGDLFKVTFDPPKGAVKRIHIRYFDTIPVATSICLLKTGFLYCASESGDRMLYELESLGDDSQDLEYSSKQFPADPEAPYDPPFFRPRPLRNLKYFETMGSMNPIMDMEVANFAEEDAPQIHTICGTGARSTFRTTRNALDILDLIDTPLPTQATDVWTSKLNVYDDYDAIIILCLISTTLVLRIGEEVEPASGTGFLLDTNTLGVQQFGENCIIQIHPRGIRHIRGLQFPNADDDTEGAYTNVTDWQAPAHRTIVAYASNNRQVAIALSSGEIYYFECDSDGSIAKAEEELALEHNVTCIAIPEVPEGRVRSQWMAVGSSDQSIRIYNISPDNEGHILDNVSLQQVSSQPCALEICDMKDGSPQGYSQYLHIGLRSGVYIRSVLEEYSGEIGVTRRRFLGPAPARFAPVTAAGENALLVITSRPWLSYADPRTSRFATTPLNDVLCEAAWNFKGPAFQGVICICANAVGTSNIRIFQFKGTDSNTVTQSIPLQYTPRKMVGFPERRVFFVIESDNNTMDAGTRKQLQDHKGDDVDMDGIKQEERDEDEELDPVVFGHPRAKGMWASCIQIVDPVQDGAVISTVELGKDQSAVSVALVSFESQNSEYFLAVGVATGLSFTPYKWRSASIHLYKVAQDGRSMEFYHETDMDEPPLALLAFKGKLVAGAGRNLSLFDCGKKSLLRKAQNPHCTTTRITGLKTQGSRIIVADMSQSVSYVVHKELVHPNRLIPFADDTVARWTTAIEMVDYDTVVGGDKFGNLWMVRCPPKVSEAADESPDGLHLIQDKNYLGGAPNRLDVAMHYFANDIPVSIQKTALLYGGEKVVFWAGLQGTLGVMIPFTSRHSFKLFQQLELTLRSDDVHKPISGRDHLAYRGYYIPPKGVIDGDLCETFLSMKRNEQERIVARMSTKTNYSVEKIEDEILNMRALHVF